MGFSVMAGVGSESGGTEVMVEKWEGDKMIVHGVCDVEPGKS
jgi:hypothetical protein